MKNGENKGVSSRVVAKGWVIPLSTILIVAVLFAFAIDIPLNNALYDLFLRTTPRGTETERVLILDIDDLAISKVGMFPWDRSIMADGLLLMKEFGAEYAVFDIEYSEKSPLTIERGAAEEELPATIQAAAERTVADASDLIMAIASGAVPIDASDRYLEALREQSDAAADEVATMLDRAVTDSDRALGRAARFFGRAYIPTNTLAEVDPDSPADTKEWTREHLALSPVVTVENASALHTAVDIRPAVLPVMRGAYGTGFPNVMIDSDGVRRRIALLTEVDGGVYPQLGFAAALDLLGNPSITVERRGIVLSGIAPAGNTPVGAGNDDRTFIPVDRDGAMLINWPRAEYEQSFRHLSYYYLVLHDRQVERLLGNLRAASRAGYLAAAPSLLQSLDNYEEVAVRIEEIVANLDEEGFAAYIAARRELFASAEAYFQADPPPERSLVERIDAALADERLPEAHRDRYTSIRGDVIHTFEATREVSGALRATRDILATELPGSICLIGWTGTATTDRGVTPFDETYDNVGTHASVIDQMLSGAHISVAPRWTGLAGAFIAALGVFVLLRRLSATTTLIVGTAATVSILVVAYIVFATLRLFVPVAPAVGAAALVFLSTAAVSLISVSRERTFIRGAFGRYLSDEFINQLLADPDRLALGGEQREMTAIFTDVQGFSTISEQLTPAELVRLLNVYLTEMSDIILELGGTIDKYEGDAIIAFFGAPVAVPDHAERACRAAIRMVTAEKELNTRVLAEGLSPSPLRTRIGINTGEMAVGNMGTARKMDYTIMGNAVNLAARLEGVNKRYGSQILISETTFEHGGKRFPHRRLDRVRVVGIHTPVRLYELRIADEERDRALVRLFHEALDLFEEGYYADARVRFEEVAQEYPEDSATERYLTRCREFIEAPPSPQWDRVFNLTEK